MSDAAARCRILLAFAAACALAAAWIGLLGAPGVGASRPALHAVLVDASASAVRTRPDWLLEARARLREAAQQAREAGAELWVAAYAEGARRRFGPGDPREFLERLDGSRGAPLDLRPPDLGEGASDLTSALLRAEALLGERDRAPGRLTWLGDGLADRPELARARFARLAADGVELAQARFGTPVRPDLALLDARAPERAAPGAPIAVEVELEATSAAAFDGAELVVLLRTAGEQHGEPLRVALYGAAGSRGRTTVELGPMPDGVLDVELRVVQLGGPDALPENDDARARITPRDAIEVAVLAIPGAYDSAVAALGLASAPGLHPFAASPETLTIDVERADALIAFDVPPDELPRASLERLLDAGGGLLAMGGPSQLVARDGAGALPLLPLVCLPPERPPRRVVLLVDRSGSMEGEPFEAVRRACLELVRATPPGDSIALRFFTSALMSEIPLVSADESGAIDRAEVARRLLALPRASGATALLYSLESLASERERQMADVPHERVVLLTDGREEGDPANVDARCEALRASFARSGTELAIVAIGPRADLDMLERVAGDSAPLVLADTPEQLTELVEEQVAGERWYEVGGAPVPGRGPLTVDARFDRGWSAPERALVARVRPQAETALATADARPLAAVWRVGAGRAAALASAPTAGWGDGWRGAGASFAPLVRSLAQDRRRGGLRVVSAPSGLELVGLAESEPALFEVAVSASGSALGRLVAEPDPLGRTDVRRLSDPDRVLAGLEPGTPAELSVQLGGSERRLSFAAPVPSELARAGGGVHRSDAVVGPLPEPAEPPPAAAGRPRAALALLGLALALGLAGALTGVLPGRTSTADRDRNRDRGRSRSARRQASPSGIR